MVLSEAPIVPFLTKSSNDNKVHLRVLPFMFLSKAKEKVCKVASFKISNPDSVGVSKTFGSESFGHSLSIGSFYILLAVK